MPRNSSNRNSFGTKSPEQSGAAPLIAELARPQSNTLNSLMNGAVTRSSVTGMAHFVMRCNIAASWTLANLLIFMRRLRD